MCCRGRVFNAMRQAPLFINDPKKRPAFEETFKRLADEAEQLIDQYNFNVKAYAGFCAFADVKPEWRDLPDCDCEGCKDETSSEVQ